ncbi:hypothetical protein Agabi119p4_2305 [Agaricus bisporus var. burnettii]|uniref:Protein SQS1 n=1 Tax=Agaricus bisporus var. burnettii TaxID=192524 RepID=A0A8H7F8W8_AGABI|nr:hypothetical protein Agabi119p4_2305 [Agaricus bisporus var. burnettii]
MAKKSKNKNSKGKGPSNSPAPLQERGGPSGNGHGFRGGPRFNQGRGASGSSFMQEDLDFTLRMYADSPHSPQASSTAKEYTNTNPRNRGRGRGFNPTSGNNYRGNGRGRGGFNANQHPVSTPPPGRGRGRGRGEDTGYSPRRGRGLGASTEYTHAKAGLKSSTFSNEISRPYLRPIKFVRAQHTPFLFQEEGELLRPIAEETRADEASHVPTADRIQRIFSGAADPFDGSESSSSSSEGEEGIEEIDFNDMGRLFDSPKRKRNSVNQAREVDVNMECSRHQAKSEITEAHTQPAESGTPTGLDDSTTEPPLFVVDTQPVLPPSSLEYREPEMPSEDEEIIVYVAPLPKISSRAPSAMQEAPPVEWANQTLDTSAFVPYTPSTTLSLASKSLNELSPPPPPHFAPIPETPSVPTQPTPPTDVLPAASIPTESVYKFKFEFSSSQTRASKSGAGRQLPSLMTPRMNKKQKAWERKKAKRERKKAGSFAVFGAMVNDARLYEDVLVGDGKDPKWEHRRKGDSDLEWGTEDEVEGGDEKEVVSEKAKGKERAIAQDNDVEAEHGMQVDSDMDVTAMKSFLSGLMGQSAGEHTTMEDLEIEERIREEDAEGADVGGPEGSSEDEDVESILDLEERLMLGEIDDDEDDESEDGFELSPNTSFQARLERVREKSRRHKPVNGQVEGDDSDEDEDMLERHMGWAEESYYGSDEDLLAHVNQILEENDDILQAHSRKERKKLFRSIHDGDFSIVQPAKKRKDKGKDLPEDLQKVWERDRQKKAELKREREFGKLITSVDPLAKKKGGKKGRKTMLKAANLDPATINLGPNRVIDFTTLVQQIRRFVSDLDGPQSISLPPANKWTRKNIHEVALAFGLKSESKGHGEARYTTLSKTTWTGQPVNERKIGGIMRRFGGGEARGDDFKFGNFKEKEDRKPPKHKEGDEVGGSAPKIGQSNMGFKMLALMGWAEGDRIGLSGGLEAPLVAIVKHSKLGLGAMK